MSMMIRQQEVPLNGNKGEENSHVHVETDSKGVRKCLWWNKRSSFERKLVLLCLLFFVVCTALVIVNVVSLVRLRIAERIRSGTCHSKECIQAASQILEKMNPMVEPCDNFYEFACGNYINSNTPPDDHFMRSAMQTMEENMYMTIKKMMERPITSNDSEAIIKVKNLYLSCTNTSIVEDYSVTNLKELLTDQGIGEWPMVQQQWKKDKVDLERRLAMLHVHQVQPLIYSYMAPEHLDSTVRILHVYSGSPVLSTDYTNPNFMRYYNSYKNLIAESARLLKAPGSTVESDIEAMLGFEYKLTNLTKHDYSTENDTSSVDDDERNKFNISMLEEKIPEIKWGKLFGYMFDSIGLSDHKDNLIIQIHCEEYLRDLILLINRTSPRAVANYLTWRFVIKYLPYLDINFRRLYNDFSQLLPEFPNDHELRIFFARWKECVHIIKDKFGMALAALYVKEESYREDNLEEIKTLISTLKHSFSEGIREQPWLDTETKSVCEEKVLEMKSNLGFPTYILDPVELDALYSEVEISQDNFLDNILKLSRYEVRKKMSVIAGNVSKDRDWLGMSPLIVNAFYSDNTMVLPLGILRPPFFVPQRPKYLNYGMIGFIIAHEITHGFDNNQVERNKLFKEGNATQWWPEEMVEKFREQANCFVDQYSPLPIDVVGMNVSGNRTLADNICDNSGMKVAYRAYLQYVSQYGEEPSLPGFSYNNLQVFYLQYAQTFCEVLSKEGYERYTRDGHSPGKYRSNIPMMNSPEFSSVFNCPVGSPMNPAKKCRLWG